CVRAYLQSGLFVLPPREREAAFGRALARVAAHELYHILARTAQHGSGLSKALFSPKELLSDEFRFDERESEALRSPSESPERKIRRGLVGRGSRGYAQW